MKNSLLILAIAALLIIAGWYFLGRNGTNASVSTFLECEAAGYPVGESYPRQCFTPDGRSFVEEVKGDEVTVRGTITCLPKVGTGVQTLECAIGLKGDDGKFYGLKNLSEKDPQYRFSETNMRVEVTGTLKQEEMRGPDGNRYDIAGVINVISIKEK